jgi:hypothetical protein
MIKRKDKKMMKMKKKKRIKNINLKKTTKTQKKYGNFSFLLKNISPEKIFFVGSLIAYSDSLS